MAMKKNLLLIVCFVSLSVLVMGADQGGCTLPVDPNADNPCLSVSDCSALPHSDCTGKWLCETGTCNWSCPTTDVCKADADCGNGVIPQIGCTDGSKPAWACVNAGCIMTCGGTEFVCNADADCPTGYFCELTYRNSADGTSTPSNCGSAQNGDATTKCIGSTGNCRKIEDPPSFKSTIINELF